MQGEKLPVGSAATTYWQQFIQDDPQMWKTEDIYTGSRFWSVCPYCYISLHAMR